MLFIGNYKVHFKAEPHFRMAFLTVVLGRLSLKSLSEVGKNLNSFPWSIPDYTPIWEGWSAVQSQSHDSLTSYSRS